MTYDVPPSRPRGDIGDGGDTNTDNWSAELRSLAESKIRRRPPDNYNNNYNNNREQPSTTTTQLNATAASANDASTLNKYIGKPLLSSSPVLLVRVRVTKIRTRLM